MEYLYLAVSLLTSGFSANIYKRLTKISPSAATSFMLPVLPFVLLTVFYSILSAVTGNGITITVPGVIAGVSLCIAATIIIESMKNSSLSICVIIVNLCFIIPIVLSYFFLHEEIKLIQLIGMIISVVVIVVLNLGGSKTEKKNIKGILFAVAANLANGAISFCIKVNTYSGNEQNGFLATMFLFAAITGVTVSVILALINKNSFKSLFPVKSIPWLLALSCCMGVGYVSIALLTGMLSAVVQFTVGTVGGIIVSLTIGFLFQGDKFTVKTLISIILCLMAILCQILSM